MPRKKKPTKPPTPKPGTDTRDDSGTFVARTRAKTAAQQALFLENYSNVGILTAAAKLSEISRSRHYEWLGATTDDGSPRYPEYAAKFKEAHEMATDRLEAAAVTRAIGWDEPIVDRMGRQRGTRRVYSDRCLELLLKARRPHVYRERYEVSGDLPTAASFHVHVYIPDNGRRREVPGSTAKPIEIERV